MPFFSVMPLTIYPVLVLSATLLLRTGLAAGDPEGMCGGPHTAGDRIVCYVSFQSDPALSHLELSFNLHSEQDPKDRGVLPINFILRKSRKICPKVYEVSDTLEPASLGTYLPAAVVASVSQGTYRIYTNGYGFKSDLIVEVGHEIDIESKEQLAETEDSQSGKSAIRQAPPVVTLPEPGVDKSTFSPAPPVVPPTEPGVDKSSKLFETVPPPKEPDPGRFPALVGIHGETVDGPCEGGHGPGAKVTCYLVFYEESAFTRLYLSFYSPTVPEDQRGLCNSFMFQDVEQLDPRTYQVTGVLPGCASGSYVLSSVMAQTLTSTYNYRDGSDYKNQFPVIRLDNPHQKLLPDITYVGPVLPPCE